MHNGIIENYQALRRKLTAKGYRFVSETDTEVLAHLLDYYYSGNPMEAITKVLHRVEGSYALGIMFNAYPDQLFAVRKNSPLVVGQNESGCFLASDVPAVLKYTRTVTYVDNQEIVRLRADHMHFYTVDEEESEKEAVTINWDEDATEKGGYDHCMLKEMYEQPQTVLNTLSPRIKGGDIVIEELKMTEEELRGIKKIFIAACGSAYHAGVTGKYVIEGLAGIPVEVKSRGAFVLAVTCEGNTEIEKAADYVIYIPETSPYFANFLAIIPLQLFGYYVAVGKGCDVDKPRNLAKSVTVE